MGTPYDLRQFDHAFNQQDHNTQQARNALETTIPLPPFEVEWGYAHGTSECMWPPVEMGGEPDTDYVERVVVLVQNLPLNIPPEIILKAARKLTGNTGSDFGILYFARGAPGSVFVYCTDANKAQSLAELLQRHGLPHDLDAAPSQSSAQPSGSGSGGGGLSEGDKRRRGWQKAKPQSGKGRGRADASASDAAAPELPNWPLVVEHCEFRISSLFLQHLREMRNVRGKDTSRKLRVEWERTHPSGWPEPPKKSKKPKK
ncbi:hypothetical protein MAPG_04599 [Magnaporthiopsis poae ATCC 64411]|uniref:Uncharacterized protein n=1 Tax=Magnaporthiopsis poae (strain ATCC 64411 / 73-15) TaxID=644358 RepID=A0A0C4DX61_MAGP6|nr:hypothetical protein MAPG_04599 [Magnaporthiopsis poae ATCC 64411]